ncbi:hypothetical protein BBP40_002138 [Aspergillus hancockii]|nr:hypothetical protein BBP40_002138 [Aspergillus hancockii]
MSATNDKGDQRQRIMDALKFDQLESRQVTIKSAHVLLDELGTSNYSNYGRKHLWNIEVLQHLFRRAITFLGVQSLTCFIDAPDEYEEKQVQAIVEYFESFGEHTIRSRSQLYVCFSSRHYPYITVEKGIELVLEDEEGHAGDITGDLESGPKIGRSKQSQQIRLEILEKTSGIFLWMVLIVQILNREFQRGHLYALCKRLRDIPAKLSNIFKSILTRDNMNMDVLLPRVQWILFARRPLKRQELYFAILSGEPDNLADA